MQTSMKTPPIVSPQAWEAAREFARQVGLDQHPQRKSFQRIWNHVPGTWVDINDAWINTLMRDVQVS